MDFNIILINLIFADLPKMTANMMVFTNHLGQIYVM